MKQMAVWLVLFFGVALAASVDGDQTPDGRPAQCILPDNLRMHNTGGSDGAGLCVFTSIEHSALYQNVPELVGFQAWMKKRPGGGYPEKVDRMIEKFCQERKVTKPRYIQITNGDLELLVRACQNHRMPAVTYSYSPSGRYNGQKIAHMVSLEHADLRGEGHWGILDNNYPEKIEWLTTKEFKATFGDDGWAVILLHPGPPPTPINKVMNERS